MAMESSGARWGEVLSSDCLTNDPVLPLGNLEISVSFGTNYDRDVE